MRLDHLSLIERDVRRPTSRISSPVVSGTMTVVPLALTSRNKFMISSDRSGRGPGGSSASTSEGCYERAGDRYACCSTAESSSGRLHAVL